MTVLGIGMSDKEEKYGWEAIGTTTHPPSPLMEWALKAWMKSFKMADEENPDWKAVCEMQNVAMRLEKFDKAGDECTCTERDVMGCPICREIAKVLYDEREE